MIQELHTEYRLESSYYEDKSKCLDLVSGSGFKIITEKAYKKFINEYSSPRYEIDESTIAVNRIITREGLGRVTISAMVKRAERVSVVNTIQITADELSIDDIFFSELYSFGEIDKEEFLKALAVAKAVETFRSIKEEFKEREPDLKRVSVKFATAHRYTIEMTHTELP